MLAKKPITNFNMKTLPLFEFIKPGALDRVVFEALGDVTYSPQQLNPSLPTAPALGAAPDFLAGYKRRFGGNAALVDNSFFNTLSPAGKKVKAVLVEFIIKQLPNVKLYDIVKSSGGDFTSVVFNQAYKNQANALDLAVLAWLQQQEQNKDLVVAVNEVMAHFGGKVSQLIRALAPEITLRLKGGM